MKFFYKAFVAEKIVLKQLLDKTLSNIKQTKNIMVTQINFTETTILRSN